MRKVPSLLLAAVAFLAAAPAAFPQDSKPKDSSGKKEPPKEPPEQVEKAKALEKKLGAKNMNEVIAALEALGAMATPTAAKILQAFIRKTPNSEHGSIAVKALGWAGNRESVDFLCGPDGARSGRLLVAEAGCKALANVGDKAAIPTLLELIKTGKSVVISAAIESVVALDPQADGLAVLLAGMTGNSDDRVRNSVAEALGSLQSPKAVDALILMASRDGNSLVRLAACRSLGKLRPAKARKTLEEVAAKDKSQEVRQAAEEALRYLPSPEPAK